MVPAIDLAPLTNETIEQMNYGPHDLWLVKLGSVVFGPFESESLKHYVLENEFLFEEAEASRVDEKDWKPFWAHTKFQRRKIKVVQGRQETEHFYLLEAGIKTGPLSFNEIDKRIEMGLLVLSDRVSVDDGHHWVKLFELEAFDRRAHNPDDLPLSPNENLLHKASLNLVSKLETPHFNASEELAELAWSEQKEAKILKFNIDELTLKSRQSPEISPTLKWAVPSAICFILSLAASGYYLLNDAGLGQGSGSEIAQLGEKSNRLPVSPTTMANTQRLPASTGYVSSPAFSPQNLNYPTYTETHDQHPAPYEHDSQNGMEADSGQGQEHSLVNDQSDGQGIDTAMNSAEQTPQDQPVIEEASDF